MVEPRDDERLAAGLRAWVDSGPAATPDAVRSGAPARARAARRRRVIVGALSTVVLVVAVVGATRLGGHRDAGPNDLQQRALPNQAQSSAAAASPPNGCRLSAVECGSVSAIGSVDARVEQLVLPADAVLSVLSVVDRTVDGRVDEVRVLSVDDPDSVSTAQLDQLRAAVGAEVLLVVRCVPLAIARAAAADLRATATDVQLASGVTVTVDVDERRGVVVLTGDEAVARRLIVAVGVDPSFIEFRSN